MRRGNVTFPSSPLRMLLPLSGATVPEDKTFPCHSKLSKCHCSFSSILLLTLFCCGIEMGLQTQKNTCRPFFTDRIISHWDRRPREVFMARIHRLSGQCSRSYSLALVVLGEQGVGFNDPYGPLPI